MLQTAFDRIASYLPRYFQSVGLVLSHPVAEVSERARNPANATDALTFWLISQVLAVGIRFIAYNAETDQTLYFAANLISSAVTLAAFSAAFFWVWGLAGATVSFASVAAAVAYVWGALTPVAAVVTLLATGVMRSMSPDAYTVFVAAMLGCANVREIMAAFPMDGAAEWRLVAAYLAVVVGLNVLYFVYLVAFLRIMRRIGGIGGSRFVAATALSLLAIVAAGTVGTLFFESLMQGVGRCDAPADTG